jgi:hypothetical protein
MNKVCSLLLFCVLSFLGSREMYMQAFLNVWKPQLCFSFTILANSFSVYFLAHVNKRAHAPLPFCLAHTINQWLNSSYLMIHVFAGRTYRGVLEYSRPHTESHRTMPTQLMYNYTGNTLKRMPAYMRDLQPIPGIYRRTYMTVSVSFFICTSWIRLRACMDAARR